MSGGVMATVVVYFSHVFSEVTLWVIQVNVETYNAVLFKGCFNTSHFYCPRRTIAEDPTWADSPQVALTHTGYFYAECSSSRFAAIVETNEVRIGQVHPCIGKRCRCVEQHRFVVGAKRVIERFGIVVERSGQQP